jgi:hypothetical protein
VADSLRELVMKNIKTTLATITTGGGYANTVASVQRYRTGGQSQTVFPMIIIREGAETSKDEPLGKISHQLAVDLLLIVVHDPATDARESDEVMNSFLADVQKAMLTDRSRGGYAVDTKLLGSEPLDVEDSNTDVQQVCSWEVHYRHSNTNPAVA